MKKPRRPKRPKKSSSLAVWQKWDARMKTWKSRCKAIEDAPKRKEAISAKYR